MDKITFYYGRLDAASEYHWLPLCFPLLCTYLERDKVEVVVIDERIEKENTLGLIDKHLPESLFLGISSFTGFQLSRSIETARYVKEKFPHIPIVWGGPHTTALPVESLKEDFVDIVVVNRGETVLPRLIKGLKGAKLDGIPGVYFKKEKIAGTPNHDIISFDSLPPLPYEVLKIKKYLNPETMVLNLTTSWGCSNRCAFCFWYRNCNPWSGFDATRVFKSVCYLKEKYGVRKIYFNEANYFSDNRRSLEIARKLKPLDIKYLATARVDELNKFSSEEFKLLEESGLYAVFIGLESGSPRMLKLMNKQINLADLIDVAANSRNTNITLFLSLLFQIPDERIEDVRITYDYVERLKKINPNIRTQTCSFTPLPSIPLTRLAAMRGFKMPQSMEEWTGVIKKDRFENKPWLTDEYAREYKKVFNELFPESQTMVYAS